MLLAVLLGGHAVYWHMAMGAVERGFDAWVAQQRQAGWSVAFGPAERGGYPFAAALAVPDARLAIAGAAPLDWRAERVRIGLDLWRPWQLAIGASGAQMLRLGQSGDIPFRSDALRLLVPLAAGGPHRGEIGSARMRAELPLPEGAAEMTIGAIEADVRLLPAAPVGGSVLAFSISATAIRLPDPARWALGAEIAAVRLQARLQGPLPGPAVPAELAELARRWRDGGGTLAVEQLDLRWGALDLAASGEMGLDARLQPAGDGRLRVAGHGVTLDALTAKGVLSPAAARAARLVLALFARPAEDPKAMPAAEQPAELPFSLRDRRLMLGQFPVTRLPVLRWESR